MELTKLSNIYRLLSVIFISVICSALGGPPSVFASTPPAVFLTAGIGARALGMGGAFTALSDDASAPYWNPAGMVQLKKNTLSGTYAHLFLDIHYHFLTYIHHFSNQHFSIGWLLLETSNIQKTDSMGNGLGSCKTTHNAYLFSYATRLRDKLSIGITLKSIRQHLDTFQNQGWGCDFGLLFLSSNFPFGLTLEDIGKTTLVGESAWDKDQVIKEYIPPKLKLGIALRKKYVRKIITTEGSSPPEPFIFEINIPFDITYKLYDDKEPWKIASGLEIWLNDVFGWRAGWQRKEFKRHNPPLNGFSTGCSIKTKLISLDYAFIISELFNSQHRFSFNISI